MFWIVFVGLKLAELAVIVFVPWRIGRWLDWEDNVIAEWSMGLGVCIAASATFFLVIMVGYGLVELNILLAKSIVGGS